MGQASAVLFAREGAKVVCADRSGEEEQVAKTIGDAAIAAHVDVSVESDVERMIATAEEHFGKLDVLYNNAGFGGPIGPLHEQSTETWERVHDTNLKAVFFGMKYGIRALLRNGRWLRRAPPRPPVWWVGKVIRSTARRKPGSYN